LRSIRDVAGRRGSELCEGSNYHRWRVEWGADELTSILSSHYLEGASDGEEFEGRVTDMKVVKRNGAGRARVVEIRTDRGKFEVRADKMRWALRRPDGGPLRSTFFELKLEKRRGQVKKLVANGKGWGHGVGMCQWGAIGMADRGFGYKDILHHYYKDIDIERLYGPAA
jgi:stage II sporulation protein D